MQKLVFPAEVVDICFVCSTASSHSHDSPAVNHVNAQLLNILDEPLPETAGMTPLQSAPPSAAWDAFAAPPAASGPSAPSLMAWSAFDTGAPVSVPPALTSNQRQPQQQQQQQQPDMDAGWAAFGNSTLPPQQRSQLPQQTQQQHQQQQQAPLAQPPAVAPLPPRPPARQELPLVSSTTLDTNAVCAFQPFCAYLHFFRFCCKSICSGNSESPSRDHCIGCCNTLELGSSQVVSAAWCYVR